MKNKIAWKSLVTGVLALAVMGSTTAAALPPVTSPTSQTATDNSDAPLVSADELVIPDEPIPASELPPVEVDAPTVEPTPTGTPTPVATPVVTTPVSKQVSVTWEALDRTIHKRDELLGLTGKVHYVAPQGANSDVVIMVSHQKPGQTTWEEIGSAYFDATVKDYVLPFLDWNQELESGVMKYKVEVTAGEGTVASLPAGFVVDYNKTTTVVTTPKLAGKTLTTDSLSPFAVTGKINGSTTRMVGVQRYDATRKIWYVVSNAFANPNQTFSLSLPSTKNKEQYRIFSPSDLTHKAYYGPVTTVNRTSPKAIVSSVRAPKPKVTPWTANQSTLWIATRRVYGEALPKVTLQELRGGRWTNVQTVSRGGMVTFNLPKGSVASADTTKVYRYVVGAMKFADAKITPAFAVRWDNPRR